MNMELEEDIFEDNDSNNTFVEEPLVEVNNTPISEDIFNDTNVVEEPEPSLINDLLKGKGIDNSMINIIDENGEEKEVNFYDLTKEEQLEILLSPENVLEENLDDSEIELINHLRTNNLSIDDFLAQYRESILAEVQKVSEVNYNVDAYNDHELFLLDLKNKYDLTDEELQAELEKELQNEVIFKKKIDKTREEYKSLEDQDKTKKQAEIESQRDDEYNQFVNGMVDIATNINDFHGVFLEDNEKQETLSYLLDLDESGISQFSKDLNNPNKLYEAAWYMRYGKEAFKALESAYETEITRLKKEIKSDKPRVVVQNSKEKEIKTIHDLI